MTYDAHGFKDLQKAIRDLTDEAPHQQRLLELQQAVARVLFGEPAEPLAERLNELDAGVERAMGTLQEAMQNYLDDSARFQASIASYIEMRAGIRRMVHYFETRVGDDLESGLARVIESSSRIEELATPPQT